LTSCAIAPAGELFDLNLWVQWFSELDRSFLFLLILPFVVAAIGLWAEWSDRRQEDRRRSDDTRAE